MNDQNDLIANFSEFSANIDKQIKDRDIPDEKEKENPGYKGYPQYYSELFTSPNNIVYCKSDQSSDIGTFSSIIPFPEIILHHYKSAIYKATLGCFTEIHKFFCTIDNKLFLWSINNKEPEQLMEESVKVICCACLCGPDIILKDIVPELSYMLVLATPKYIKILKVVDDIIDYTNFYLTEIKFAPSCIVAGPNGQILIGADSGRIFLAKYDEIGRFVTRSIAYSYSPVDSIYGIFPRLLRTLVGYSTVSIVQLVFDTTFTYIAAIDANSHLRFFGYDPDSSSCTILSFKNTDQYEVASVCAAPTVIDDHPQFIAFSKTGTRLLIEKSGLTFYVVSQRDPPDEFQQDEVMCAQSFMGLTVMVCKQKVILLRGQRFKDEDDEESEEEDYPNSICEYVSSHKLAGTGISIGVTNSDPNWADPLIWQHHREPPVIYILTAAGGYKYKFSTPSEQFSRLVISSNGFINDEIEDYLSNCCKKYEPVANSILASFQHPECDDLMIYMITQYAHQKIDSKINTKSQIIRGLIVRISRILAPLWFNKIFESYTSRNNYKKYRVTYVFSNISPYLVKQLEHTKEWAIKYLDNLESNTKTVIIKTSSLLIIEQNDIKVIISFIELIIQIISFLGYLSGQKKQLITDLIKVLERESTKFVTDPGEKMMREKKKQELEFLTNVNFGDCLNQFPFFFDTLKEFNHIIFTKVAPSKELDAFGQQIIECCSSFSHVANSEYQIKEALERLASIRAANLPLQERKGYFPYIVNSIIEYAEIISIQFLNQIVSTLVLLGGISESIQIIEAKVKSIDPSNRAIQSYKLDLNTPDDKMIKDEIFDFLRIPLSVIESLPDGLDYLMKSELEIIHIYVFDQLYQTDPNLLVSLNSKYLYDFLKKKRRDYLWKYLLIQKDYKKAYKEIIDRFSSKKKDKIDDDNDNEDEIIENERIQMLQMALRFARNSNESMDEIDEISKAINGINISKKKQTVIRTSVSNKEEQYYREMFAKIDTDGNGVLDRSELLTVLHNDDIYLNQIFGIFKDKKKDSLTFEEFMEARAYLEYRTYFDELQDENDDDDALGEEKLKLFYQKCHADLKISLADYIKKNDTDNDGKLTFSQAISILIA